MTKEEYKIKLDEYVEEQKLLYMTGLNKFNAHIEDLGNASKFLKRDYNTFDLDASPSLEELTTASAEATVFMEECKNNPAKALVYSVLEYESDYDGDIESMWITVGWATYKEEDIVNFEIGERILERALREILNRPVYSIATVTKNLFLTGAISWDELVGTLNP